MIKLLQGFVSEREFQLLIQLTSIRSENKIASLRDYLVKGFPAATAYHFNDVKQQHFSEALRTLEEKYAIHVELSELNNT